jgi:excisionase family DNA binding protein
MKRRQHSTPQASVKVYSVTVRQAADMLGVSMETVKRWARSGRVEARKNTSGNWVFASEDVDAMIDRNIVVEVQP